MFRLTKYSGLRIGKKSFLIDARVGASRGSPLGELSVLTAFSIGQQTGITKKNKGQVRPTPIH
jgi:hypothetical protein